MFLMKFSITGLILIIKGIILLVFLSFLYPCGLCVIAQGLLAMKQVL